MREAMDVFLGFDPGGNGNFGWSICRSENDGLLAIDSGLVNNALEALQAIEHVLTEKDLPRQLVRAAGIDAPMFWTNTGFREIDVTIRNALRHAGCEHPEGTVQAINSLRSACSVQGVLLGHHLALAFGLSITEAHPKALDWLDNLMRGRIVNLPVDHREHERDATFAAYAAWRMWSEDPDWNDLYNEEPRPILLPLETQVSYWMPTLQLNLEQ